MQLAALDTAQSIDDMDIPGFRLHPLKGEQRGRWSITVNSIWRVTFEFQDGVGKLNWPVPDSSFPPTPLCGSA